jgi:hypothetical protein
MKFFTVFSLAMCFALTPFAAHATDKAVQHHRALHYDRAAISATATALVPAVPAVKVDDDSDGLSRNREDCNRGCIDSN